MSHQAILIGILICAISVFFTPDVFSEQSQDIFSEQFLTYTHWEEQISIEYPESWIKIEDTEGLLDSAGISVPTEATQSTTIIVSFADPDTFANLNIVSENLPFDMNIEKYYELNIVGLKQFMNDFEIQEYTSTTVDNLEAINHIFTTKSNDPTIPSLQSTQKLSQTFFTNEGKGFAITFTASPEEFNAYQPIVEKMINSIKIN